MDQTDKVALRCPHCGSMAAGRVNRKLHRNGNAEIKCMVCKKTIRLPAPKPFLLTFFKELNQSLGIYFLAFKKMGWLQIVLSFAFWIIAGYVIIKIFHFPSWAGIFFPSIPFLFLFARAFSPLMQAQIRNDLGVLRIPAAYRGLSERDPLPIQKFGDVERIIHGRTCPNCRGNLKITHSELIISGSGLSQLQFRLLKRAKRMLERVKATCNQCDFQGYFYFDISSLDIVKKYGYTVDLIDNFPKRRG